MISVDTWYTRYRVRQSVRVFDKFLFDKFLFATSRYTCCSTHVVRETHTIINRAKTWRPRGGGMTTWRHFGCHVSFLLSSTPTAPPAAQASGLQTLLFAITECVHFPVTFNDYLFKHAAIMQRRRGKVSLNRSVRRSVRSQAFYVTRFFFF